MPLLPMVGLHQSIASRRADSGVASHLIENSPYVESGASWVATIYSLADGTNKPRLS
jgi:hypothetical protein